MHQQERISDHARARMDARRLSLDAVEAALAYGRVIHARGARIHVIGRKEIGLGRKAGIDLAPFEGVQVLCDPRDGHVITIFRNRDFRGLRPRSRRRRGPTRAPRRSAA